MNYKWLENCSYSITSKYNGTQQVTNFGVSVGSHWELVLNITYNNLVEKLKSHFDLDTGHSIGPTSIQQFRNHQSTLTSFLVASGKTTESRVGVELGSGFDNALKHYLSLIDVAARTKRDRRQHLHLVRRLYLESSGGLQQNGAQSATSLSVELRTAISKTGLAPKTLAKKAGLSTSALQRWIAGALPNKRGVPTLRRLECELGLPRDAFVKLLNNDKTTTEATKVTIPYRENLKVAQGVVVPYRLPESALSPDFKEEWHHLLNYKASTFHELERQARGKWRCIPANTSTRLSPYASRGTLVCPSADIFLEKLRSFLGVIFVLPAEHGGFLSDSSNPPQTLAWLAHTQALSAWLTRNPDDYLTVAELLNDLLSTVLSNYAHLKRDKSFLRYEEHVQAMLGGNKK